MSFEGRLRDLAHRTRVGNVVPTSSEREDIIKGFLRTAAASGDVSIVTMVHEVLTSGLSREHADHVLEVLALVGRGGCLFGNDVVTCVTKMLDVGAEPKPNVTSSDDDSVVVDDKALRDGLCRTTHIANKIKTLMSSSSVLQDAVRRDETHRSDIISQLAAFDGKLAAFTGEVAARKADCESERVRLELRRSELMEQLRKVDNDVEKLKEDVAALDSLSAEYTKRLSTMRRRLEQTEQNIRSEESVVANLQSYIDAKLKALSPNFLVLAERTLEGTAAHCESVYRENERVVHDARAFRHGHNKSVRMVKVAREILDTALRCTGAPSPIKSLENRFAELGTRVKALHERKKAAESTGSLGGLCNGIEGESTISLDAFVPSDPGCPK
eukprot:PhM_4_TR12252/c0_g1_i1/m.101216